MELPEMYAKRPSWNEIQKLILCYGTGDLPEAEFPAATLMPHEDIFFSTWSIWLHPMSPLAEGRVLCHAGWVGLNSHSRRWLERRHLWMSVCVCGGG